MITAAIAAIIATVLGVALYLILFGSFVHMAITAKQDPDIRFAGVLFSLLLVFFTACAVAGIAGSAP